MTLGPEQSSSSSTPAEPHTFVYSQPPLSTPAAKTVVEPTTKIAAEPGPPLLAPAAAAATAASVGTLIQAVTATRASATTRSSPSIEDVVREELRLMLKGWVDAHLPTLVERLVRAEIERLINQSLS